MSYVAVGLTYEEKIAARCKKRPDDAACAHSKEVVKRYGSEAERIRQQGHPAGQRPAGARGVLVSPLPPPLRDAPPRPKDDAGTGGSNMSMYLMLAAGAGAVWFFFLRKK